MYLSPLLACAEVADACAFLASDDSRYITGISLEVAGKTLDLLLNSKLCGFILKCVLN